MVVDITGVVNILDEIQGNMNLINGCSVELRWFYCSTTSEDFSFDDLGFTMKNLVEEDFLEVTINKNHFFYLAKVARICSIERFNDGMDRIKEQICQLLATVQK